MNKARNIHDGPYDAIIVGAGPTGLSCAISLASLGLSVALIDKQKKEALADPPPDGRDIALTHFSKKILTELNIWQKINPSAFSSIREARVLNGSSSYFLKFEAQKSAQKELGFLVSNHLIRKATYEVSQGYSNITLIDNVSVKSIVSQRTSISIMLENKKSLQGSLLIAADGRFSEVRRLMGIPASLQDFGKTIIVCQMHHDLPHDEIAHECFFYGTTLAVLPLCENRSSIVMTVSPQEANDLIQMKEDDFNTYIETLFKGRLGAMKLDSQRFSYPLVSVYADRFVGTRFVLIGDAAVGMHPVTAHGFNFGLKSQYTLSRKVCFAHKHGLDIGSSFILDSYQHTHRQETKPLYLATNAIVRLYISDARPAKMLREALIRVANRALPIKKILISKLTTTY